MSASDPASDPFVDPDSISALLQWRKALQSSTNSKDLYDSIIRPKLNNIDSMHAIQQFAHIFDNYLADLEFARNRTKGPASVFEIEHEFLRLQVHPSNIDFQAYLNDYSVQLWKTLMPNHLPDILVHALITPALKSTVELVSTPWVVHLFISTVMTLPLVTELLGSSKPSYFARLRLLRRQPADYNPFIRDLLYRLGSSSVVFRFFRFFWSPLDDFISVLINRIVLNATTSDLPKDALDEVDAKSNAILAYIRDWLLVESHNDPTFKDKAEHRARAIQIYPRVFGSTVLKDDTFDYYLINRRLVISAMDEFLAMLS